MKHFLDIESLSKEQIEQLLQRAFYFKQQVQFPNFENELVAYLFYENSTRTRISFELAAHHLSMKSIIVDLKHSSESKGETIEDTIKTLGAMGIQYCVMRHSQNYLPQNLASMNQTMQIINAGDGTHAHPSQALLDIMTISEKKPDLQNLKVAIIGDVRHSRVANSFQQIALKLGIGELIFVAPPVWQFENLVYGQTCTDLKEGLQEADVVMCLRVQKERIQNEFQLDLQYYRQHYALTKEIISFAKPNALVMHPGPLNRGIEIDKEVAESKNSVILEQVSNGVFARMAIFEALVNHS